MNIFNYIHIHTTEHIPAYGFTVFYCYSGQVCEVLIAFQGYALLCVGFPTSDVEVETQDEDEVMSKTKL